MMGVQADRKAEMCVWKSGGAGHWRERTRDAAEKSGGIRRKGVVARVHLSTARFALAVSHGDNLRGEETYHVQLLTSSPQVAHPCVVFAFKGNLDGTEVLIFGPKVSTLRSESTPHSSPIARFAERSDRACMHWRCLYFFMRRCIQLFGVGW